MASQRATPKPTVSYQDHKHPLSVIEGGPPNPDHPPRCYNCGDDIRGADEPYLCCSKCDDFHLHLRCGPLPLAVTDKRHSHLLELADVVVEDDSGEYYCEVCEERRDPRECVYYCSDCVFISHLKCVFPEVIRTLKGELGSVALRTVGDWIPGKIISEDGKGKYVAEGADDGEAGLKDEGRRTLKEIFKSLSDDELNQFRDLCQPPEPDNSVAKPDETEDGPKEVLSYSDKDFKRLLKSLDSATVSWETLRGFYNMESRVVPVLGQEVVSGFANVLGQLLKKYGKFDVGSTLSGKVKIFIVSLLCDVVHELSTTSLNKVTEANLRSWWIKLRIVRRAGFKVELVIDHLTKVVCAYFGVQATKSAFTMAAGLDEEVASIKETMKSLEARLEALTHERGECLALVKTSRSDIMKRCLDEASRFGLSKASKGLIP